MRAQRRKNGGRKPGQPSPPAQLGLFERGRHGGARPGAGRKRSAPTLVRHRTRPRQRRYEPAHVTLRLVRGLPSIRKRALRLREAVANAHKNGFRICQISIQTNHIHMIVEADDKAALARGVQGFAVRVARSVNRVFARRGRVFAERYHARALRTPRTVRNTLVYVLFNHKHHGRPGWELDPFSSAKWFDGAAKPRPDPDPAPAPAPSPVAPPQTWLLATGWRRLGLIQIWECPAERHPQGASLGVRRRSQEASGQGF